MTRENDREEREGLLAGSSDEGNKFSFAFSRGNDHCIHTSAERYEQILGSCGFGKFQKLLLFVCGWALASDSTEVQVVSFVLPAACDLEMTSSEKGWLNAIIFVGMMIGGYAFGGTADIKGRRFILLWSMTINGFFGLLSAFAPNFSLFLLFRLLSGVGVGAAMPVLFTYAVEFITKEWRGPMIGFLASFWMVGNILTAGIAWLVIPRVELGAHISSFYFGSWRIFVAIGAFPSLSSALLFFFLPESPKFLQKAGRLEDAKKVFNKIYKINHGQNTQIPDEIISIFDNEADNHEDSKTAETMVVDPEMCSFCQCIHRMVAVLQKVFKSTALLFKSPLTTPTLVLIFVWFTLSFGYYGLWMWFPELFNRVQQGGSCVGTAELPVPSSNETCLKRVSAETEIYLQTFLIAISNLPGNILTILIINKIGRRALLALSMILSAVSVFFFWLVKTKTQMILMSCLFSGLSVAGWNALDALALENYPSQLRSTAFGLQALFGRVAAILGNVVFGELVDVHCSVPILLVVAMLCAGGLSVFKLPKTDNVALD